MISADRGRERRPAADLAEARAGDREAVADADVASPRKIMSAAAASPTLK